MTETHHHHHEHGKRSDSTSKFRDYMRSRAKRKKLLKRALFYSLSLVALIVMALVIGAYFLDR